MISYGYCYENGIEFVGHKIACCCCCCCYSRMHLCVRLFNTEIESRAYNTSIYSISSQFRKIVLNIKKLYSNIENLQIEFGQCARNVFFLFFLHKTQKKNPNTLPTHLYTTAISDYSQLHVCKKKTNECGRCLLLLFFCSFVLHLFNML